MARKTQNGLTVTGESTATGDIYAQKGTANEIRLGAIGAPGLIIGGDCDLYRVSADNLKTDDSLTVAANFTVVGTSTIPGFAWIPVANIATGDTGTINSTTLVTVCTVTLPVGTWYFTGQLGNVGNATASTVGFNLQGTAVTSLYRWTATLNNGTATSNAGANSSGTTLPNSTSGIALASIGTVTTENSVIVSGMVTVTTAGTLILALNRTTGTGTFVGKAGSTMFAQRTA